MRICLSIRQHICASIMMRICLSIKTGNRRHSSKQPERRSVSLPGQPPSAVTKSPYHPQRARPAQPASHPRSRVRPSARTSGGANPPCCAHRVAGMRVTPAHRLPRPPPPDPAAQPRSGRLPTATPANHPDGQHRTRCSRRHRRRQPAGRYLLPGDASASNGDGLSPTEQRRWRLLARSRRRRRCRRCLWFRRRGGYSSAVATPGRRRRC